MEVDVKAIDRYVEARDDGYGTKPWHGAIAVAAEIQESGVNSVLVFGVPSHKDPAGTGAYERDGVAQKAIAGLKENSDMLVIADADADIDSIASSMNMTRNMLFQRCSETLGATPAALLQRMRMERACQLFDAGERRVKEVAWQTGFNDPKYFAKVFKKTKGMTPTQYVENQREKGGK